MTDERTGKSTSDSLTSESLTSDSLTSDSSLPMLPLSVNYLRIMLLDAEEHNVLMQHVDDRWDLPYFIFPQGFNGRAYRACQKLQRLLGYDSEQSVFTGIFEFLGNVGCDSPRGYDTTATLGCALLLFVEPNIDLCQMKPLPPGFEWKDLDFLSSIEHDDLYDKTTPYCYRPIIAILKEEFSIHELLPYPPFQPGWFRKASEWLVEEVVQHGASTIGEPFQFRLSHSSAIIVVNTTENDIFLKGVAAGSKEIEITTAVVKQFPRYTPDIMSVNEELQSLIARRFYQFSTGREERLEMLRILGTIQRASVEHVEYFVDAGVPSLKLQDIEETLKGWTKDEAFVSAMGIWLPSFKNLVPSLMTMVKELDRYNLPMCIVHGDFSARNVGFKFLDPDKVGMILHDWEFGAIAHPFFDFHDYREEWGDTIDTYLGMWNEFETLERARRAYEISEVLGWLLKLRGLLDTLRKGDAQGRFGASVARDFLVECFQYMERQVKEWTEKYES